MRKKRKEVLPIKETDLKQELKAADLIGKSVISALKDKEQFKRYIVTEKCGGDTQTREYVFGKYDFKAIGEMVRTVKALEELKRSASDSGEERKEEASGLVILPQVLEEKNGG